MLWYRWPDGSFWKSLWLGSLMILLAFLTHLPAVNVLEGAKHTSDCALIRPHCSMQCIPVESGAAPVPDGHDVFYAALVESLEDVAAEAKLLQPSEEKVKITM